MQQLLSQPTFSGIKPRDIHPMDRSNTFNNQPNHPSNIFLQPRNEDASFIFFSLGKTDRISKSTLLYMLPKRSSIFIIIIIKQHLLNTLSLELRELYKSKKAAKIIYRMIKSTSRKNKYLKVCKNK